MDDINKSLQELNLTARQPHHMIQAATSVGLAKGLYVAARVGFEPVTFLTEGTEPTTEPPRPYISVTSYDCG